VKENTMSTDRREVLKGLVAAGLLVSSTSWAKSLWQPGSGAAENQGEALAVSTLVSGSLLDQAFLDGVQNALLPVSTAVASPQALAGLSAETFNRLSTQLQDGEPALLLALLDDASAVLVLDLIRSAGAKVLAVQHHHLAAGAQGEAEARALGQALVAGGSAHTTEQKAGTQAYVSLRCVI
jgi:hypothetical protein